MSFVVVGDLLEDTITRSAKNQSDADGELSWLRKRLDIARRDPRSKGKLSRGDKVLSNRPRAILKQAVASVAGGGAHGNKENPQLGKAAALGTTKVRLWLGGVFCPGLVGNGVCMLIVYAFCSCRVELLLLYMPVRCIVELQPISGRLPALAQAMLADTYPLQACVDSRQHRAACQVVRM